MAGRKYAYPGRIREGNQRRRLEASSTAAFTFEVSLHRAGSQPTWRKEGALHQGIFEILISQMCIRSQYISIYIHIEALLSGKSQHWGLQFQLMEACSDQTKPRCELMQSMSSMGERDCENILPEN